MNEQSEKDTDHDAVLRVFDATNHLKRKLISWRWADGRRTMSPDENAEVKRLTDEAESKIDPSDLDHGTVLARIWMEDETVERVEWNGQYTETDNGRTEVR